MSNLDQAMEKSKNQTKGSRTKILLRLLKLVNSTSPWMLIVSMITIVLAAASNVIGSLFIERLINNYIVPLTKEKVPNYVPLATAIAVMFGIYAIGFLSNYLFNMLMGVLAQKVQYRVRNEMFVHMESLPIAQISQQLNSIVMALAGAERIFNLEDQKSEADQGTVTLSKKNDEVGSKWYWNVPQKDGSTKKVQVRGHIIFDHVNFSYVPDHQILHDISINAKPGMKVALVGETGAGKTTISNMLNRFYDIDSGTITYDGIPIKNIKKDDLRKSLSIVLQETHLFTGTIMDNIRFGNPDASDDDVYQAAKLSHADEFIHDLDHGYETVIDGDGGDLSQGQIQLLSIARAMIADEPVMILDEATSSIDTRTEKMVQAGMDNLLIGRTSFVIAHRLSTIVNSDLILVLDHVLNMVTTMN